jgi:hypothetical protein
VYGKKSDFKDQFHKLVHHMIRKEEFEDGWASMLEKYSLQKHPFLTQIYEVQDMWAKPYFKGVFCAKMTSTQRSESANHLLKTYVPPACPVHLFIRQYEKLQFDREDSESYEKRTSLVSCFCVLMYIVFMLPIDLQLTLSFFPRPLAGRCGVSAKCANRKACQESLHKGNV